MEYFSPKSFLLFSPPKKNKWRLGQFKIDPVNDQYNNEMYWLSTRQEDDGSFVATICNYRDINISTNAYKDEASAIKQLEVIVRELSEKKVFQKNIELNEKIEDNLKFLESLK